MGSKPGADQARPEGHEEPTAPADVATLTLPGARTQVEQATALVGRGRAAALVAPQGDGSPARKRETGTAEDAGSDLVPGQSLGRYRLIEMLGAGTMGVVWSAKDPSLDRKVAIKVVHSRLVESDDSAARFLREARAMAKVSDRAVVSIFDAGRAKSRLFIAMELITGSTLGATIRSRDKGELRDWQRWMRIMLHAGQGLAAAHHAGVLHRDFKPDNILVEINGRVCVSDFGLAELNQPSPGRASSGRFASFSDALDTGNLTVTGTLLGTPVYMSPEQLRSDACDERSDQFSFCVATYEVLYGERPFDITLDRNTPFARQLVDVIESQRFRPAAKGAQVPARARQALLRGLANDPSARWPSMDLLLTELRTAMPVRKPRLVAAIAIVSGIAVTATLLATRHSNDVVSARLPELSSAVNSNGVRLTATHVIDLPHPAILALSPSGKKVAISSRSRSMVYDIDNGKLVSRELANHNFITTLDFSDENTLNISTTDPVRIEQWRIKENTLSDVRTHGTAKVWFGELTVGSLIDTNPTLMSTTLQIEGHPELQWATNERIEHLSIAPDRKHFAYVATNLVVVVDIEANSTTSLPCVEVSALTWSSDSELLYAAGTSQAPTIYRVAYDRQGFGQPQLMFQRPTGWIGELLAASGHIYMVLNNPIFQGSTSGSDLQRPQTERITVDGGGFLSWLDNGDWLAWDSSTLRVQRVHDNLATATAMVLTSDAANASRDGDSLIVATRRSGVREVTAYSITSGARLWSHGAGVLRAVRCAGDRSAPCFAVKEADVAGGYAIVAINSKNGELSPELFRVNRAEDFAVALDGSRIAFATMTTSLTEYSSSGELLRMLGSDIANVRTITYAGADSWYIGGVGTSTNHSVQYVDGNGKSPNAQLSSEGSVISLIRLSIDGTQLGWVRRRFDPRLYELVDPK
jgi:serine/threonine protein kinase